VDLMQVTVSHKRAFEESRGGLVVLEARYGAFGDCALHPALPLSEQPRLGPSICVAVPLQCAVENSTLILQAGESKAWLEGFFDPCADSGEMKRLAVRYLFRGVLHQVRPPPCRPFLCCRTD
jgi:DnaJ family protein C protein 11